MMFVHYASKKALKECIGKPLRYTETSMFGPEFKRDGSFTASNRPGTNPQCPPGAREFFAEIEMRNGLIHKVS